MEIDLEKYEKSPRRQAEQCGTFKELPFHHKGALRKKENNIEISRTLPDREIVV